MRYQKHDTVFSHRNSMCQDGAQLRSRTGIHARVGAICLSTAGVACAQSTPFMISAFYGLDDELNGQAAAIALSPQANPWNVDDPFRPNPNRLTPAQLNGLDGLPVVFSELLDPTTVDPSDFLITTASGATHAPVGATVNPAHDVGERRTVALFGEFGDAENDPPVTVSLVGDLLTTGGVNIFETASPIDVIPLADGSTLAYAETVDPATVDAVDGSELVLRAVWTGGIVGADGNEVTEPDWSQYVLSGTDAIGNSVELTPIGIGDLNDNDNNHLLYFDQAISPGTLFLPGGLLIDPNGDHNPATSIAVVLSPCGIADLNGDGLLDLSDINLFISGFLAGGTIADLNGDDLFDLGDISLFTGAFVAGCP